LNSQDEYLLFVHEDRSPEDSEAERILSEFIKSPSRKAKLRVNERREADTRTPALYANLDYFLGIDEIKAFVDHERLLIP
jgi:hypothetical protein